MSTGYYLDDNDREEGVSVPWYLNGGNMRFVEENKEVIESWRLMRHPAFWEEMKAQKGTHPKVVNENKGKGEEDYEGAPPPEDFFEEESSRGANTAGPSLVLVTKGEGNFQDVSQGNKFLPGDNPHKVPEKPDGTRNQILVSRQRFEQLVADVEELKKLVATSEASNCNGSPTLPLKLNVAEGSSTTTTLRKRRAKGQLQCNHCDLTFKHAPAKCLHMQAVHEGKRWKCHFCEKTFSAPSNRHVHMKQKHSSNLNTGRNDPPDEGNVVNKIIDKDQDKSPGEA